MKKTSTSQGFAALLTIFAAAFWVAFSFFNLPPANASSRATETSSDCPRGPLHADLTGSAIDGKTPNGMAQFKERGNNSLTVMVRDVNVAADTSLSVMVGGASVGTISIAKNGNGQLRVDTAPEITEGTALTVMNGATTILAGQFQCVGKGGGATPSPTVTMTPLPSPTITMTPTPTIAPSH